MYKERAQCGVWTNNEAPKPSKLKRHMETKQPADFFKRKENGLQMQKSSVIRLTRNSESDLKASHLVARRVAQETFHHSGGVGSTRRCGCARETITC